MTGRADFLRRLPTPTPVEQRGALVIPPVLYRDDAGGALAQADPRQLFGDRWRALGGQVHRSAAADVAAVVARIVAGRAPVLVGTDPLLDGVAGELRWPQCGVAGAAEAEVAVVAAVGALAATGSVVLDSRVAQGRSGALLAPEAIFVLSESSVVGHLGALLRHTDERWPHGMPSQLVIVSGPSRSADIEHTLTRGVHGPGEVHAIIVS